MTQVFSLLLRPLMQAFVFGTCLAVAIGDHEGARYQLWSSPLFTVVEE